MFKKQEKVMISRAKSIGGVIRAMAIGCLNEVYFGCVGWERVAISSILYGAEVINMTPGQVNKLEKEQVGKVTNRGRVTSPTYFSLTY